MKRFILSLVLLAMLVLPVLPVNADKAEDSYAKMAGVKVVTSSNTDVTYMGKHWKENGDDKYEYIARIHQAPIYNEDGSLVDCSWHGSEDAWVIVDNVFSAQVIGSYITVTYQGKSMSWNPVVMIDSKEYAAKGSPKVLAVDPVNENYRGNTLEWDYGVCVRRVRVIEGLIQETWTFDKDPKGNVWIRDYAQTQQGFEWEIEPYGYDADGNPIAVNEYKQVAASVMASAVYPVTIDPTEVFVTSASDGYLRTVDAVYATCHDQASSDDKYDTSTTTVIGQAISTNYYIWRSYFYFDTSSLPDGSVLTASNLSLYGYADYSTTNFNIVIQDGQPTYPHDPLQNADFDYTKYAGAGSAFSTAGFVTTGYNNISLTAAGLTYISLTGATKLALLSSEDIADSAPANNEYIYVYTYEKGAGFRPTLYVTYVSSGPPDVTTNAATYVTKTTAKVNGYLDSDGGEATDVWFLYHPWYNTSWAYCLELTLPAPIVGQKAVMITNDSVNAEFWSNVNTSGLDIVICDEDFVTPLNREIITINTTTSELEMYANVSAGTERLYVYFGNPTANISDDFATYEDYHEQYSARVAASADDCTAYWDSAAWAISTTIGYSDIGYVSGTQFKSGIGLRFLALNIPRYSHISSSKITLTNRIALANVVVNTRIVGELTGSPSTFSTIADYQARRGVDVGGANDDYRTVAEVSYDNIAALVVDEKLVSPELKTITQEQVDNNTLTNVVYFWDDHENRSTNTNGRCRRFWTVDSSPAKSPLLTVDYIPKLNISITETYTPTTTQSKNTGDSFYSSLSGLTTNTLYGFRAMADQTQGTDYGEWLFFDTTVTLGSPSNVTCKPDSDSITLTWTRGGNTSYTYIRYKTGGYPTGTADGNAIPLQSGVDYVHTGLTSGVTYYYKMWGEDAGTYSATNSTTACTTSAGFATSTPVPLPTTDTSGWSETPNGSVLTNNPLYALGNLEADEVGVPHDTWWMLLALGGLVCTGLFIYTRSRNLLAALGAMIIFGVIMAQAGLFPIWTMIIFGLMGIGFGWKEIR